MANKERNYIQSTHALKKTMIIQIQKTKQHLQSMKKNQQDTHTRMNKMQINQLYDELDSQSKQYDKLVQEAIR